MLLNVVKNIFASRNGGVATERVASQMEGGLIVVFTAYGLGNAITGVMPMIIEPVKKYSSGVVLVDFNVSGWQERLEEAIDRPIWFVASYFGVGYDVFSLYQDGAKINFWEYYGVPFLRFYGDIPAYFPERHAPVGGNVANIYFDVDHELYFKKYFGKSGVSICLPPIPNGLLIKKSVDIKKKAKGKVVFPKNGGSPESLKDFWRVSLSANVFKALDDVSSECVSAEKINNNTLIDEEFVSYFKGVGFDVLRMPSLLSFLVAQVDDYVRRYKSTLVVKALLGLPVVINGVGWRHVDFSKARAELDEDCDFFSTEKKLPDYLAVIDSPPNTHYLVHDRISRAVGERTAFVTSRHKLLEEKMGDLGESFYSYDEGSIQEVVSRFVDNPEWAADFGIRQSDRFYSEFCFDEYVKKILTLVDVLQVNSGGRPEGTQSNIDFPSRCF